MKIAIASFTFPPNSDGVSLAAATMAGWFMDAGHEVHVLTSEPSMGGTLELPDGMTPESLHRFPANGFRELANDQAIAGYCEMLRSLDPDVVVFHCWNTWPIREALPILDRLKAKTVMLSHGFPVIHGSESLLHRVRWWGARFPLFRHMIECFRRFDCVVFLSRRRDFGRFFDVRLASWFGLKRLAFIANGVSEHEEAECESFRSAHGIENQTLFLCIANYVCRKNQRRALDAFKQANIEDAMLVFIGSDLGEYGRAVREEWVECKKAGALGEVKFLEAVPRDETIAALQTCDVFVLAADAETQPIVLLEAMAAGKPFISTDTGCVSEFRGGLVVADAATMASAMKSLHETPQLRECLGKEGRDDFECSYSETVVRRAWLDLLEDLELELRDSETRISRKEEA